CRAESGGRRSDVANKSGSDNHFVSSLLGGDHLALVERRGRRRRRRGGADADDGDILNANEMWHSPDALACIGIDETYRGPHPISGGSDAPIDVVSNGRGLSRPPIYLMPGVREIQD